jgi:hypothetical protein
MKKFALAVALAFAVIGGTLAGSFVSNTPAHACSGNNCD